MTVRMSDELRDSTGKLLGYHLTVIDESGRQYTSDVTLDQAVGISIGDVVSAVHDQLDLAVKTKVALPAPGVHITAAGVQVIAASVKATKMKPRGG